MTQGERIKELRKSLGLTLEKFGAKLGVSKTAIYKLEKGENNLTEPMTKAICREFSVNHTWLTTGEGEMFLDSDDAIISMIDRVMSGDDEFHKNLLKWCATSLSMEELYVLKKMVTSLHDAGFSNNSESEAEQ